MGALCAVRISLGIRKMSDCRYARFCVDRAAKLAPPPVPRLGSSLFVVDSLGKTLHAGSRRRCIKLVSAASRRDDATGSASSNSEVESVNGLVKWWRGRGKVYSLAQALLVPAALPWMGPPLPTDDLVDAAAQLTGGLAVVLGVSLMVAGIRDIGENFQFFPEPRPAEVHALTTRGVMGQVRHPQYSGTIFFCWGVALLTGAGPARLLACLATNAALVLNAQTEDGFMSERYGSEFDEYRNTVPGMVPRDLGALVRAVTQRPTN